VITIRRLSLGAGYKYLMDSIAAGDGRADMSSPLTRYYAESGTPPGAWMGAGLAGLGGGQGVETGSVVSEDHLAAMLGELCDPVTGEPVGGSWGVKDHGSVAERVARRTKRLGPELSDDQRAAEVARIAADERRKDERRVKPVAGFDLTFSPVKSISTAWALADQGTKAVIYACHRDAIAYTLARGERTVFHSRSGKDGVVQEDLEGVVAASFTHYDTRSGDPQLHDHVVVWNRAKSTSDGKWRTLDSRGLFKQVVTMSEVYDGVVADMLTGALGLGWDGQVSRGGMVKHEVAGVPGALMAEFSQRVQMIHDRQDELIGEFRLVHGRAPTPVEKVRLAQRANLETRPAKCHRSLAEMTEQWRDRAGPYLDTDPVSFVTGLKDRNDLPLLRAEDLADEMLGEVAFLATQATAERHSTFSRANILAEVHRQLHGVRFASPDDRVAVAERAAGMALDGAIQVSTPELNHTPSRFRRSDGTSRLRPLDHHLYTTATLLEAEGRLLDAGQDLDAPRISVGTVAAVAEADLPGKGYAMSVDQALAVEKIATSGRRLDVLVGPAGTGKSTTMAGLRAAWEAEHGPGSVIGLAPSAAAAEVLAEELGIDTENTAKWLHEWRQSASRRAERDRLRRAAVPSSVSPLHAPTPGADRAEVLDGLLERWSLRPGQLVIVDEASLAGTFATDELVSAATDAGAKLLLVGDPYQLSAVDAGGMFATLVADRSDMAPELSEVRRFAAGWEKIASVELRVGDERCLDIYTDRGRIGSGTREEMIDALYAAWSRDVAASKNTLMIAGDAATVGELNRRARAERIAAGVVSEAGLKLADGSVAGVGDEVVTRQNNRRLATGRGFVKNGDRWVVTGTGEDGTMTVRRAGGPGQVVLPTDYVSGHVELAYATTAHRAQGRSVDTAHAMVSSTTTREVLYVSATRGRDSNRLYVDTFYDPAPETSHDGMAEAQSARQVLYGCLQRVGADRSAHDTIRAAQHEAESIVRLHAEYDTLAATAQADRWDGLLERSGLSPEELRGVRTSAAYGPLLVALRDAEGRGLDVESDFPLIVAARDMDGAEDPASVLHGRVDRWVKTAGTRRRAASNLVAGLIPRAVGITDPDMVRALNERDAAIEARACTLAAQAVECSAPWTAPVGPPPAEPAVRHAWAEELRVVAAYRERWAITGPAPVGSEANVATIEQIGHYKRALAAVARAATLARGNGGATLVEVIPPADHIVEQKGVEL